MFTLICSASLQFNAGEIIGYIIMILEILLVLIKFLQVLVPSESKFGKFLAKFLKGITFVNKTVHDKKKEDKSSSDQAE